MGRDIVIVARAASADAAFADIHNAVLRFLSKYTHENNSGIDHKAL
jgi:hypothetical protein